MAGNGTAKFRVATPDATGTTVAATVRKEPSARAGAMYRVSSSWWAPWALLAGGAGVWLAIAGAQHGQSVAGFVPPVMFAAVMLGHPRLRARCAAGAVMLAEAARIRAAWEGHITPDLTPDLTYRRGRSTVRLPRIAAVSGTPQAPILRVESLPWRDREERWGRAAESVGKALGRPEPSITIDSEHVIISFGVAATDGLTAWRDTFPKQFPTDLERVQIARDATGQPMHLGVLYNHTFVFGATGSGKGSVLWSIIAALAPGIPDGLVQLWGMDPKGGMEFTYGEHLFHRMGDGTPSELRDMLRDLVGQMRERADRLKRERVRKFVPSPGDPMVVLLIDEYLSLIMLQANAKDKTEVSNLLLELLSKGRAIGFVVIGAAQLAQKEYLRALREMFTQVVCLRTTSQTQTTMSLEDALEHGAAPHKIPLRGAEGTGYVKIGSDIPVKVRFAQWTDADIEAIDKWVHNQNRIPYRSVGRAGTPPAPGVHHEPGPALPAPTIPAPEPAPDVPRPPSKSDTVRAYLDSLPAGVVPTVRELADATSVSVGLASKVRSAFIRECSPTAFTSPPGRNEVPVGDPTEHVKSTSNKRDTLDVYSTVMSDPTAGSDPATTPTGCLS